MLDLTITRVEKEIQLEFTIRSNNPLNYSDVVALQETLVSRLDKPVSLIVNHIESETLDPLIPPTQTLTPTQGSSPTWTITPTQAQTNTATLTETVLPSPTATEIPSTPTPLTAFIIRTGIPPYYNLYLDWSGQKFKMRTEKLDGIQKGIYCIPHQPFYPQQQSMSEKYQ